MSVPQVVIVGRPNVGKSSLLNWLAGRRISIVDDQAGVTRDRVTHFMEHNARFFELVDTGGIGIQDTRQSEQAGRGAGRDGPRNGRRRAVRRRFPRRHRAARRRRRPPPALHRKAGDLCRQQDRRRAARLCGRRVLQARPRPADQSQHAPEPRQEASCSTRFTPSCRRL